jgi:hypothetical protein
MKKEKKGLGLQAESNAALEQVQHNKVEIRFPQQDGFVRVGRYSFKDLDDLLSYLSQAFPVESHSSGNRFLLKRKGKYQRINESGQIVFTFGDPVLDVITDEHGWMILGGVRYDLHAAELADPGSRGGGIRALDLSPRAAELDYVVSRASLGEGNLTLVEAGPEHAVLASKNPSTIWFYDGAAKMRFRAFKKNYGLGWKMGADVETWGGNFTRAEIQSEYGYWFVSTICAVARRDSDSDTNDDYVDEYEWGIASASPNGVKSFCTATWRNKSYGGTVSTGNCGYWL